MFLGKPSRRKSHPLVLLAADAHCVQSERHDPPQPGLATFQRPERIERAASDEIHSDNYFGLSCKYEKGDRYWVEWWLAHGHILVYITYNADVGKQDSEIREIQLIVESLRIAGALSLS